MLMSKGSGVLLTVMTFDFLCLILMLLGPVHPLQTVHVFLELLCALVHQPLVLGKD